MKQKIHPEVPSTEQLEAELKREKYKHRYRSVLRSTIYTLITVAAFVMGDHRSTSVDSRNTAVGCVAQEQIVGKIIFRIWPMNRLGTVE